MLCLGDGRGSSSSVDHGVVDGSMENRMNGRREKEKKGMSSKMADQQDGVQRKKKRKENRIGRRRTLSLSQMAHLVACLTRQGGPAYV